MPASSVNTVYDEICVQFGTPQTTEYYCFAAPGTLTSQPYWKIMRLTYDGSGNITKQFASGTPAHVNIAANYASYTYA